MSTLSLEGRKARCEYCSKEAESKESLPFFKRGGDRKTSPHFIEWKKAWADHDAWYTANLAYPKFMTKSEEELAELRARDEAMKAEIENLLKLMESTATGDSYYCGCMGWD